MKKILVAFDGSPKAYEAFEFALKLAAVCNSGAEITVLSVAQPPEPIDIVEVDAVLDAAREHYGKLLRELREKAKERNVEIKTEIVEGHPADQIVRYARENGIDQIVMGQRGKSKIESWLLGSVSKRVASYAPCAVTIVK
jgi:nucleotide-binding universal stress UspA family protein